uniref:Putative ribonuclease H-like domain-containing protein n=1 Tax=Tanacetum cinerariifolium TaxID=118510 RepID=A0A6L2MK02_TANCI|nr:putative ribonuclease H-like domain-containing protein [Tanacetum cinerariifolium]
MVYQMDVKSVFIYGKIEEEVYVCQPPGFEDPNFPDRRGMIDKALFLKRDKRDILLVQVYVDDIIFGSTRKEMYAELEKMMHNKFQISSMGELTFLLRLQVKQKEDWIFISQDKYVNEILTKFGFSDVKTASTPMETHKTLLKDEKGEDVDEHLYIPMIGSLMYLTSLRPDIMFAYKKQTVVANFATEDVVKDTNEKKLIKMIKIHIDKNVANLLTKVFDPTKSAGFEQIIDFLNAHPIKYALIVNPTIYTSCVKQFWANATMKNINGEAQIHAKVDEKKVVISEASIRRDLRFGDEGGIDCLPNETIFEQLLLMRVLNLETTKTAQAKEIANLKKSLKRLERKKKSRSHGLKRLYKVRLSARVESSADEESLGEEDASKQERISNIDANQYIYFVNVHRDEDIFGVNDPDDTLLFDADKDLQSEEVVVEKEVAGKDVSVVKEINAASIATTVTATTPTFSMDEITLAKALIKIKTSRPKAKEIVMQEPSETSTPTPTVSSQQPSKVQDEGKGIMKRWKAQTEIVQESSSKRAWDELEQESSKTQKIKDENESAELKRCLEVLDDGDEVTIDATPLSSKSPTIVDYKIYKEMRKSFFQIFKADVDDMDIFLLHTLKTMFEHHVEDTVWKSQQGLTKVKNWKLFDSCGVNCVITQNILYYLLVEKMYPLTYHTLHQMLNNVKLQVYEECEIAYELLRLVKKQLKEGYRAN